MKNTFKLACCLAVLLASSLAWANDAHKALKSMSDAKRENTLSTFLKRSGYKCPDVTRTFYQGSDKKGNAIWNAQCKDGAAYIIQVKNDAQGSTHIMTCAAFKKITNGDCFKEYDVQ